MTATTPDILAEVEVWHSRPVTPTRRLSLGNLVLPVEPAPGLGGVLLAAIVANFVSLVDEDLHPDLDRLITQVDRGERVTQPRLRHRFQIDRHGLARSIHRMVSDGETVRFQFSEGGTPLQHTLSAIYSLERLDPAARRVIAPALKKAMRWRGPLDTSFMGFIAGTSATSIANVADPRAWALEVLGFPVGTVKPTKKEVQTRFRDALRSVHPDHGGDESTASRSIDELGEARRILLG